MISQERKLLVYRSHLESHIQYGILLWGNGANNSQISRIQKLQNKALQYVTNKSNALENKKGLQVLDINSLIELSNLKFGYKVLHNLLPPVTTKLCMFYSSNKVLSKQHNYDTRNKKTPYLPKNASTQYKNSFLCREPQSLLTINAETRMNPRLIQFIKHCKGLLLNKNVDQQIVCVCCECGNVFLHLFCQSGNSFTLTNSY